ncbi:MAG: O-acetyl-ADP-ribose deacetylase [Phycisphaerae bacterium]
MSVADPWKSIQLVQGDITRQDVDAIVNAANSTLLGGGGVDGAIHRAAGPELLEACRKLGGCDTGSAKITPGFKLPAEYVIHAVGPRYRDGQHGEAQALASCYGKAIELAEAHQCKTVAFSAISCGVYGYPIESAARVSMRAVADALSRHEYPNQVRWVLFNDEIYGVFAAVLKELEGGGL